MGGSDLTLAPKPRESWVFSPYGLKCDLPRASKNIMQIYTVKSENSDLDLRENYPLTLQLGRKQ